MDGSDQEQRAWSWRVEERSDNKALGLLYEPGNWGDVLKGTWAILLARALARQTTDTPFHYLDPFAGSATYPLTASAASRLEWLGSGPFVIEQARWLAKNELASTGLLVREAALSSAAEVTLEVFDTDPRRLESWKDTPGAQIASASGGEDLLKGGSTANLVLVDPYDLFDRWRELSPSIVDVARSSWVLLYLYNKSPRGAGYRRNYRDFRERLKSAAGEAILGRVPSDLFLPRAYHEVVLIGPSTLPEELSRDLLRATKNLACKMSTTGSFERLS